MIDFENPDDKLFKNFKDVFETLDTGFVSPSESVVNNLIQFAQSYEYIDLGPGREAEMILN